MGRERERDGGGEREGGKGAGEGIHGKDEWLLLPTDFGMSVNQICCLVKKVNKSNKKKIGIHIS